MSLPKDEDVTPKLQTIPRHSTVGVSGDPATQRDNLRADGDQTYFADDPLVHIKT